MLRRRLAPAQGQATRQGWLLTAHAEGAGGPSCCVDRDRHAPRLPASPAQQPALQPAARPHPLELLSQGGQVPLHLLHPGAVPVPLAAQHRHHRLLAALAAASALGEVAALPTGSSAGAGPSGALCCKQVLFQASHQLPLLRQLSLQLRGTGCRRLGLACRPEQGPQGQGD